VGSPLDEHGLSMVGCRLGALSPTSAGGETGAIALLGPDRMDFAAVIPLVEYASRALTTSPE
jgi:transcriptional regulator of heat shock response